jgi:Zn-dependent protease
MLATETENLTAIVSRFFDIHDVTHGDARHGYLVRYRGRLRMDPTEAYDQIAALLRPIGITPLFRMEKEQQAVLLVSGVIDPKPSKTWVSLLLMGLTFLSIILAGIIYSLGSTMNGATPTDLAGYLPYIVKSLGTGLAFAASLSAILLAHEFGHYLAGRYHNTNVTLPFFIPLPIFSPFGTLGAFIQLKEPPKNRRILLDIGVAGPLAGLVVAIPVLLLGLSLSRISGLPASMNQAQGLQLEGNSILYLASKFLIFGKLLPQPSSYAGLSPVLYWLRYFFTSQPFPLGGQDVLLHPVAWAGWAGLLVTALNLVPAGQLDGGHLMFVLLGKRVTALLPYILVSLVLLGFVWPGWWIWAALIFLLGRLHAEPLDQITPLDTSRKLIAVLGIVIFVLVFTPVPLVLIGI